MRSPRQRLRAACTTLCLALAALPVAACGEDEAGPVSLPTASAPDRVASTAAADADPDQGSATSAAGAATGDGTSRTADDGANGADGEPFDAGADAGAAATSDGPASTRDADERVAVVQAWAEGYARAASENDPDYGPWLETMTDKAAELRKTYFGEDLGLRYPGPLPFTVTQVVDRDGGAIVEACVMTEGFAIPQGGAMSGQVVAPTEFHLRRDPGGDLLVDGVYGGGVDCRTVLVEGKPW